MELLIDCREKALIERMPLAKSTNLIVGDICIQKDGMDVVIIERKTVADLSASICDGRYKEQSFRLLESNMTPHRIVYLIEGSLDSVQSMPKQTLLSATISLWFHKGFTVIRTDTIDETVNFINLLFEKAAKETSEVDYVSTLKIKKKSKLTPSITNILILSQIPTVSTVTAKALLDIFNTPFNLSAQLIESPECLDGFTVKNRKIPKNTIAILKEYLAR